MVGRIKLNRGFNWTIILLLTLAFLLLLLWYQSFASTEDFAKTIIELVGAIIATFLGVYVSFGLTISEDYEKELLTTKKIYSKNLKLLRSELSLDLQNTEVVCSALETMPRNPSQYFNQYSFLIELSKSIKTVHFNTLIGSTGMDEIADNDELFNAILEAFYNIELFVVSLNVSRNALTDKELLNDPRLRENYENIINGGILKAKDTARFIRIALNLVEGNL